VEIRAEAHSAGARREKGTQKSSSIKGNGRRNQRPLRGEEHTPWAFGPTAAG
jgi:hypothetical protein